MDPATEPVALLRLALNQTAAVIAAIPASAASAPTPCPDWDVRALVQHLTGQDLRNFALAARGETVDWQAPADELGMDWAADFSDGAGRLLEAWRTADPAIHGRADQQIAELATHGWDLVRATWQQTGPRPLTTPALLELDPVLAEHALAWSRGMLRPEYRGPDKAFGFEVPVPPDAPAYDRLAGWFGREPAWSP